MVAAHHRFWTSLLLFGLTGWITGLEPASAEPAAWVVSAGQIRQIDLTSGTFGAPRPIDISGTVRALAHHPSGEVYALSETCCPTRQRLVSIDVADGRARILGSLGHSQAWLGGLTVDPDGRVWLAADGVLWTVDLETGMQSRVASPRRGRSLLTATATAEGLYGITGHLERQGQTSGPVEEPRLVRIDVETGLFHPVRNLPRSKSGFVGLAADEAGGFWFLEIDRAPKASPPAVRHTFWRFDPRTGALVSSAEVLGNEIDLHFEAFTLTRVPNPSPTIVPTLDTLGLIVLGLVLALTAQYFTARRRYQPAERPARP